jgi:DNA-binding CsgD family transcriptional regulator
MTENIRKKMLREKERLKEMYYDRSMSLTEIGEYFGCSRQYVQLIFIKLGLRRRTRKEALKISPRRKSGKYKFTPENDKYIIRNCDRLTDQEIASAIGKPVSAVTYRRLSVLKRKKNNRKSFSRMENQFILRNYRRMTDSEIARYLNRSLISVTHHRNRILKCPKRIVRSFSKAENRYILNNYFRLTDREMAEKLNRSKASVSVHRHDVLGLTKSISRKRQVVRK